MAVEGVSDRGVSAQEGVSARGVSARGVVKTLPFRNYVADGNNTDMSHLKKSHKKILLCAIDSYIHLEI